MDMPHQNPPDIQHAEVSVAFGSKHGLKADVDVTPRGLLAIAALVSAILLSTAVLVGVAVRSADQGREDDAR